MNERIQELMLLAGTDTSGKWMGVEHAERFAQLIVRECMNAVCDPRTTYLESMTESSAMYTARERIRKHFGD
jgi:uncharacterized iron-regulated protein